MEDHTTVRYVFEGAYCEWTGWKRGGVALLAPGVMRVEVALAQPHLRTLWG